MSHQIPLTPVQEQIIRDLLASGRFRTEDDIVHAALRLLKDQSLSPAYPVRAEIQASRSTPRGSTFESSPSSKEASVSPPGHRSPYGIFSDIRSDISAEEIAEARREMWAGFPRNEP